MTTPRTPGRCPTCGGELYEATRNGVRFRRCLACGSALLDAAALEGLLPSPTPRGPQQSDYDYPVHYPQDDRGHAAARPKPAFSPDWSSSEAPASDDPDAARLMYGG